MRELMGSEKMRGLARPNSQFKLKIEGEEKEEVRVEGDGKGRWRNECVRTFTNGEWRPSSPPFIFLSFIFAPEERH